jgi:hypothetical protein
MRRPIRNLELAKLLYGSRGGQARKRVTEIIDLAMMNLWLAACDAKGPEYATQVVYQLVCMDAEQPVVAPWFRALCVRYRAALVDE